MLTNAVGNDGEADRDAGLARIQPSSDAVNGIGVGASDGEGAVWARAPYSSVGPGRSPGFVKPDLVTFGGGRGTNEFNVLDLDRAGHASGRCGTSFSSPYAMRAGIGIRAHFGTRLGAPAIKALLVHHADAGSHHRHDVGWGRLPSDLDRLVVCDSGEAHIVYQGLCERPRTSPISAPPSRRPGPAWSEPKRPAASRRDGRTELQVLLDFVQSGDTLVVTRIDRLAQSMKDLQDIVHELEERGVALRATEQPMDTRTAAGKAFLDMLGLRRERQFEGIKAAKARGGYKGRKPTIDAAELRRLCDKEKLGPAAIARQLGIGRASVYRVLGIGAGVAARLKPQAYLHFTARMLGHPSRNIPCSCDTSRSRRGRSWPRDWRKSEAEPVNAMSLGSPPLARGQGPHPHVGVGRLRFTPARAGTGSPWQTASRRLPVHPRSRGQAAAATDRTQIGTVHPRSRGDRFGHWLSQMSGNGSPPLARGQVGRTPRGAGGARFTPARAGTGRSHRSGSCRWSVHPRSRGDRLHVFTARANPLGSPPLARGQDVSAGGAGGDERFTPARAGTGHPGS